jgi:hypothetical protein
MTRQNRAGAALAALAMAGFLFADAIGYGSDKGYHLDTVLGLGIGFVLLAALLFAWNVVTYKNQGR